MKKATSTNTLQKAPGLYCFQGVAVSDILQVRQWHAATSFAGAGQPHSHQPHKPQNGRALLKATSLWSH